MRTTAALLALAFAAPVLAACSSSSQPAASPASSPAASSPAARCHAKAWPLALPDLRGERLDDAELGDAVCFTIDSAIGPDGTNVLDRSNNPVYVVVEQSPAPGTLVGEKQPISLTVKLGSPN